jgi:hypothetical protein
LRLTANAGVATAGNLVNSATGDPVKSSLAPCPVRQKDVHGRMGRY